MKRVRKFVAGQRGGEGLDEEVRAMIKGGATDGEIAQFISKDVPEEELRRLPGSDHIDEVVFGVKSRAVAK